MKETFKILLAGIVFKINSQFDFVKEFCKDFLTEKEHDYEISITQDEIKKEQEKYSIKYDPKYLETTCVYRNIAELLPQKNRIVVHGVALKYNNQGYLFVAPSGTGKTTHSNLWREYLGDKVEVVNGDKPILEFTNKGIIIHSSPWCGKEGMYQNITAKLKNFCIICRDNDNCIKKTSFLESFNDLLVQIYLPENPLSMEKTLELIDLFSKVQGYVLNCNISKKAFVLSFEALTEEIYEN